MIEESTVWLGIKDGLRPGEILVYDAKKMGKGGESKFRISGINDCLFSMAVCKNDVAISTMDGRITLLPAKCKGQPESRCTDVRIR